MADKPIIFSAPMIRALLDGRKTQTRRVLTLRNGIIHDRSDASDCVRFFPGDRLYVREAFAKDSLMPNGVRYVATDDINELRKKRPSIHMPRWASRLTLTVTEVGVQRLQEISEADACAEGCKPGELNDRGEPFPAEEPHPKCGWVGWDCARDWYADLWDSLHGPGAWDLNPWVAAYTFTVHRCNIDCLPAPLGVEQRPQVNRNIRRKTTSMAAKGGA